MDRTIQLLLYAHLSSYTPGDAARFPITAGTTVAEVVERIGVPLDAAKIIFINGRKGELDHVLNGGERLGIFPPVAGG
jgi:molybdopterin converting factor small subunit